MSGLYALAKAKLSKLRDVDVTGLADGDTLIWQVSTQKWLAGTSGGSPAGSDTQVQFNDGGAFGGNSNFVFDKTNKRVSVQAGSSPQSSIHGAATVGTTINNVVTGSVSLVTETLPATPSGSITAIAEPAGSNSGNVSFIDQGSGSYQANGTTYYFRIYPCLVVSGTYYQSSSYLDISATDPNDSDYYNVRAVWDTVAISGETVGYFIETSTDGSSWSALGTTTNTDCLFNSSLGGGNTPWPTFYMHSSGTPPNAYTGGSAQAVNQSSGGISQYNTTILMEVDSVANIGGTDYVSGSPTSGSFDDSIVGAPYDAEISWTDQGNATNSIARISVDSGSTWYYQFTGSSTSPYTFTSLSNDSAAEARWGQTYSGGSTTFNFDPYGQGTAPSGNAVYSTVGTQYGTTISTGQYYIFKHVLTGNATGKVLDSTNSYGQQYTGGQFYDTGYTSWASGTTVTPTSYGFSGTAQNRDYRAYGFNSTLGIYSATPLTLSTTLGSGSKSVSGSVTYPSGVNQIKILRQINGGGYTVSKTLTSPTTAFTDDSTDGSWNGNTTVTPTAVLGTAGRFDRDSTAITDQPIVEIIATSSGIRYPKLSFGVASNNSSAPTYQSHIYSESTTGYLNIVAGRFQVSGSLGGTVTTMLGSANIINNNNGSSNHFQVKGQNDSNLINTRSDQDTVGFGQAIGSDQQCTVQIQPARSSDVGLVMIGHSSMSDSSTLIRFQTSAGTYNAEMTVGGWLRTSTGAVGNPSHSCRSDTNTGMYFPSGDVIGTVAGGVEQTRSTTTGNSVRVGTASNTYAKIGGTLNVSTTAVGNVGTGEDNLISYTSPASCLATNGDRFVIRASGTFAANVNNKRVKLYFGTQVLFDTTALALNGGDWCLEAEVIRTGATTQKAWARWISSNALLMANMDYTAPAMTLSSSQVIKCTGEATSNNDIVQETLTVEYKPA